MDNECSICFEIVGSTDTQKPFATRCGHIFHENCIKRCLQKKSKCPQCNQPHVSSHLIRLFINEPDNSIRAKDTLIDEMKRQLKDLNEKAKLQYDLIGSLNRQLSLEKKLSEKENEEVSQQPATSISTSNVSDIPRLSKPPTSKVNFKKKVHFTDAHPETESTQHSRRMLRPAKLDYSMWSKNSASYETQGASGFTPKEPPLDKSQHSTIEAKKDSFTFGSKAFLGGSSTQPSFRFKAKQFSNMTFVSGNEASDVPPLSSTTSFGQTENLFAPTTSKPISNSKSPSSTSTFKARPYSTNSFFQEWRNSHENSPPPTPNTPNNSPIGVLTDSTQNMEQFFRNLPRALGDSANAGGNKTTAMDKEASTVVIVKSEKVVPEKEN